MSRPRARKQESSRSPDDREEGKSLSEKARRRRRRPSGVLATSYTFVADDGLSDRYLNSSFRLVDDDTSSSECSVTAILQNKIQYRRRRGEKTICLSCDTSRASDRYPSISNDLTSNVSDFRYKLDRTKHKINFMPSSRNILDRILLKESGK